MMKKVAIVLAAATMTLSATSVATFANDGQTFTVTEKGGQYWYGYSNSTGNYGYVNSDYLA